MTVPEHIINYIANEPLVFWAGNIGSHGFCDIIRSAGVTIHEGGAHLTFFITTPYSSHLLKNLHYGEEVSLLITSVASFESYQFKGEFLSSHSATDAEEKQTICFTERILKVLKAQGINTDVLIPFIHGPKTAINFKIRVIFEQTPKQGTGKIISI